MAPGRPAATANPHAALQRADPWGSFMVRRHFRRPGYSDRGEQVALAALGPLGGLDVLDVGVGGGRTTGLMAAGSRRYVGVDQSPRLISDARRRHAGVELEVQDARRLDFADATFDVAIFSYNGIDSATHEDRGAILDELHRVVRPGGRVLLSTLNIDWPGHDGVDARPRFADLVRRPPSTGWKRPMMRVVNAVYGPIAFWHYRQLRPRIRSGDGWAMAPMAGHEFRFLVHFTRFGTAVRELAEHGLVVEEARDKSGDPVALDAERDDDQYWHLTARRT